MARPPPGVRHIRLRGYGYGGHGSSWQPASLESYAAPGWAVVAVVGSGSGCHSARMIRYSHVYP
jgi:hypothetical protein